mmetsp:Transcript_35403/g.82106  ORF Transcript_35403/g.82106 Transcript_35403/m.82106 type:complete len:140 (+) Transcript_35403:1381-1800(+)
MSRGKSPDQSREGKKQKSKKADEDLVEGIQQATIGDWSQDISCFARLGFFQSHQEISDDEQHNDPLCAIDNPSEAHYKHILQQSKNKLINEWWILLDSCSTVNVFCTPRLLCNIQQAPKVLKIHSTGGNNYYPMDRRPP